MPRSFLVKTHSSHRVPNYGKLETLRGRGWPDLCPPARSASGLEAAEKSLGAGSHLPQVRGEGARIFHFNRGRGSPSGLRLELQEGCAQGN